jgi:Uncharacterized protein conserved in bacteria
VQGDEDIQRKVLNRLKRARGQLDGVIQMVEDGRGCRDVVTQLAAVSKALDRAGFVVISNAMKECLSDEEGNLTVEELEKIFLSLS